MNIMIKINKQKWIKEDKQTYQLTSVIMYVSTLSLVYLFYVVEFSCFLRMASILNDMYF